MHCTGVLVASEIMTRLGAQDLVAKTVEMVVIECNRPDVAALLLLQVGLVP